MIDNESYLFWLLSLITFTKRVVMRVFSKYDQRSIYLYHTLNNTCKCIESADQRGEKRNYTGESSWS
jgi:hypothetical protein